MFRVAYWIGPHGIWCHSRPKRSRELCESFTAAVHDRCKRIGVGVTTRVERWSGRTWVPAS